MAVAVAVARMLNVYYRTGHRIFDASAVVDTTTRCRKILLHHYQQQQPIFIIIFPFSLASSYMSSSRELQNEVQEHHQWY